MNTHPTLRRASRLTIGAMLGCAALHGDAADLAGQAGSLFDKLRSSVMPASAAAPATVSSTTPAPAAPSKVQVGRKQVALSSQVVDAHCERVVDPFELNANFAALGGLAAAGAAEGLSGMLGGGTAKSAGHKLSRSVREQAMLLNWMPMSLEQRYGRLIHEDALAAGVLVDRDSSAGKRLYPKADALLALVLSGVTEAHPYTFELHVRGAGEDNAMALPGGIVYIDAGLLREADPAKARFALAHEISHVLRRHETRIAQARIIDTISLTGATSDLVTAVREPAAISAGVLTTAAAGHKSFRQHYGDQELQADSCAVRALSAALPLVEVDAAVRSFIAILPTDAPAAATLPSGGAGAAGNPAALGDLVVEVSRPIDRHPTTRERVDNLKAVRADVQGLAAEGRTATR